MIYIYIHFRIQKIIRFFVCALLTSKGTFFEDFILSLSLKYLFIKSKEDIRKMERTLSVNYPVLRQNNRVLLNTIVKNLCLKSHQCTFIRETRRDR